MTTDYRALEQQFTQVLGTSRRPIAVAFRPTPPPGVEKYGGVQPSGCSFWRLAGDGRVFYTVPDDHANCAIGAHTHAIPLPASRATELEQTLTFMSELGYIRMEEVQKIPRLPRAPAAVVYAPLGDTPVDPDVVVASGRPSGVMLLQEAAIRAGVAAPGGLLARPTCMALPAALSQGVLVSTACVGNRVYTELGDDELYLAIPGSAVAPLARELATIIAANTALRDYHLKRRRDLATG